MTRKLVMVLAVLAISTVALLAADLSGAWKASMPGRDGATMEITFNFTVNGDKLTGTVSNQMGETQISDGKVKGDTIKFKVKRESQKGTFIMNYEGKLDGGELKMKQTMEGMDRPPREFSAKRANPS